MNNPDMNTPVTAAEADVLFAGLVDVASLLLAVSGGPDSMALLHLACCWREQGLLRGEPRPDLHVAVVDHRLRPEAAGEAAMVVDRARAAGLSGAILVWDGARPASGLEAAARTARYQLLFAHAKAIGASHVVTAHHADDLAETILMRLCAGSGLAGLAGMAPLSQRQWIWQDQNQDQDHDMWLARPLLSLTKSRLVATCDAAGVAWATDPGNLDPRKGRGKLRLLADQLEQLGLGRDRLLRLGERAARADAALEYAVDVALAAAEARLMDQGFGVDLARLAREPQEIVIRGLGRLMMQALPEPTRRVPMRLERLERGAGRLADAARAGRSETVTLNGMLLQLDRHGICRARQETPRKNMQRNGNH